MLHTNNLTDILKQIACPNWGLPVVIQVTTVFAEGVGVLTENTVTLGNNKSTLSFFMSCSAYIGRYGNPLFSVHDNLNPVVTVEQNFDR